MLLGFVAACVFVLNLPFGYWRGGTRKFSLQWALAIHLPIPFVILLRLTTGLGFEFITYPVLVGAYFAGQAIGARIRKRQSMVRLIMRADG